MAVATLTDWTMAARRIPDPDPAPRNLPLAVMQRPPVVAARTLHDRTQAEVSRCEELVTAAVDAIDTARAADAKRILEAFRRGEPVPADDVALLDARAAAERALARAREAEEMAAEELRSAITAARSALAEELRPLLAEQLALVAVVAKEAAEANAALYGLAEFAEAQGCATCRAHELALRIPSPSALDEQLTTKRNLLFPQPPAPTKPGGVVIRWLVDSMPYAKDEVCGLPKDEAVIQVKAGFAELVDQSLAKKLGVDKLVKFDRPTRIKLTRNFTPRQGAMIPEGKMEVFDPATAARLVNLGFGEVA